MRLLAAIGSVSSVCRDAASRRFKRSLILFAGLQLRFGLGSTKRSGPRHLSARNLLSTSLDASLDASRAISAAFGVVYRELGQGAHSYTSLTSASVALLRRYVTSGSIGREYRTTGALIPQDKKGRISRFGSLAA